MYDPTQEFTNPYSNLNNSNNVTLSPSGHPRAGQPASSFDDFKYESPRALKAETQQKLAEKLGVEDLIDMFDDNTEKRVQTEIRVGTLRQNIMDLKDALSRNSIDISAAGIKIQKLQQKRKEKVREVYRLEQEYKGLKEKKGEVERRLKWLTLKQQQLAGEENANILSYEELFNIKAEMAGKHAELNIIAAEGRNIKMMLEETQSDLVLMERKKEALEKKIATREKELVKQMQAKEKIILTMQQQKVNLKEKAIPISQTAEVS